MKNGCTAKRQIHTQYTKCGLKFMEIYKRQDWHYYPRRYNGICCLVNIGVHIENRGYWGPVGRWGEREDCWLSGEWGADNCPVCRRGQCGAHHRYWRWGICPAFNSIRSFLSRQNGDTRFRHGDWSGGAVQRDQDAARSRHQYNGAGFYFRPRPHCAAPVHQNW